MKQDSNVDIISAKCEISEDMRNSYIKLIGQEFLENKINDQLANGIASEIVKKYANKIKIVENIEKGSVIYCCDIMVYNPKESDNKGIQEKKTGWVNVYKDYDATLILGAIHNTKEDAVEHKSTVNTCIDTIKIEWEE